MAIKWLKSLNYQQKQLVVLSSHGCRWYYPSSTAWCVLVWGCGLPFESLMNSGGFWCFSLSTQEYRNSLSSSSASLWNSRSEEVASRKQHMPGRGNPSGVSTCPHVVPSACNTYPWVHIYLGCALNHQVSNMRLELLQPSRSRTGEGK